MRRLSVLTVAVIFSTFTLIAYAVRVGSTAPNFTGTDIHGKTHKLSDYRGKYVVLEWTNNGCPYTQKHYESGNMQALQREWTAKDVVWLTILSSAPGKQGYMTGPAESAYLSREHADPTTALLDPAGGIGRQYEAKTTPHMFVIDPSGKLIYEGAIDDHPTTDPADIRISKNYVSEALTEAMSGQPVAIPYTRPYGCSVKYPDID
ncbi:thioredoxin family protein [Paracidobacterium acidisoli]|uniref:Thioredoxin family protein n=1 Tax=Paracidobacterium acidisoli TaxID=2303751 RepID=A0A372IQY7_9BACT|nr:thioredoxin family protein [Paracidobacterium acidisoli]MBT9330218.1 thioredoxin family protein [Paracidobacterium acidisoli]